MWFFLLCSLFIFNVSLWSDLSPLLRDLEIAAELDQKMRARFPMTYNHLLSSGYFVTPSARMGQEGEIRFGFADAPPYQHWNASFQIFSWMELSGNYRIFKNIEDIHLSKHGFGDFADRGANIKIALMTPEQSLYDLPGLAFGIEDFMGSKRFTNYFVVLSQIWPNYGIEASLGWAAGRYTHGPTRGFFGGFAYFPFWESEHGLMQGAGLACEWDPIDYKNSKKEPHPQGRSTRFPMNLGIKYKYFPFFDLSFGYIRGQAWALATSFTYNFGYKECFLPKTKDPPFYSLSDDRSFTIFNTKKEFLRNLSLVLKNQGFQLTKGWIDENTLWISVMNLCYRHEFCVRERIQHILGSLLSDEIECAIVILESFGMPCQQYVYPREFLIRALHHQMGIAELTVITPREEVKTPSSAPLLFYQPLDLWRYQISPRVETFFGSAQGKFKYDAGIKGLMEGFLPKNIFYETQISYTLLSTTNDVADFDFFSPSQLPNVLTDYVNYRQRRFFSTDRAYIQKNWNMGQGCFSKLALGYFQVNYAGVEGEFLWYPANSPFAFGCEGALLKKRRYTGLGFQSKLRKMKGFTPTYIPYTILSQYFLNAYIDITDLSLAGKISMGGFLAWDKGFRFELTRYFDSGLRISAWMTVTNAHDNVHGENYFNRGICMEMPLDLLFRKSSRRMWSYGLAAWLRDAGASIITGKSLFEIINAERNP